MDRSRILVPFRGTSVRDAVRALERTLRPHDSIAEQGEAGSDSGDLPSIDRFSPRTLLVTLPATDRSAAALLVAREPLAGTDGGSARLIMAVRPGRGGRPSVDTLERLGNAVARPEVESRLLTAESADDVLAVAPLMEFELVRPTRVRDALTPMSYRIYPDTPLSEVVDLMARKGLAAVPVVGEGLQVMGIITSGDALARVLESRVGRGTRHEEVHARDVMSRAVLCVTEDQELVDAAAMMSKRHLAQLPVVREGEMVGFLTREAVLRALLPERE